jgi:hypothetical protein
MAAVVNKKPVHRRSIVGMFTGATPEPEPDPGMEKSFFKIPSKIANKTYSKVLIVLLMTKIYVS